jgi:hypothetical protein
VLKSLYDWDDSVHLAKQDLQMLLSLVPDARDFLRHVDHKFFEDLFMRGYIKQQQQRHQFAEVFTWATKTGLAVEGLEVSFQQLFEHQCTEGSAATLLHYLDNCGLTFHDLSITIFSARNKNGTWSCDKLKVLVHGGCDLDLIDEDGHTPLQGTRGDLEPTETLLELGARFDVLDKDGRTCIHLATMERQTSHLGALLRHPGARLLIDAPDFQGLTPYHYSLLNCFVSLDNNSRYLLRVGANRKRKIPPGESRDKVVNKLTDYSGALKRMLLDVV